MIGEFGVGSDSGEPVSETEPSMPSSLDTILKRFEVRDVAAEDLTGADAVRRRDGAAGLGRAICQGT